MSIDLSSYGTSLEETRRLMAELAKQQQPPETQPTTPSMAGIYTPEEAKEWGITLDEGWFLKLVPDTTAEGGYKQSLINPQKWELTDFTIPGDTAGTYKPATYIDPEGNRYTSEQVEAEGEEFTRLQGLVSNIFPERDVNELFNWLNAAPENVQTFQTQIKNVGQNENTVALLKQMFPGATDEEIQGVFAPEPTTPISFEEQLISMMPIGRSGVTESQSLESKIQQIWQGFLSFGRQMVVKEAGISAALLRGGAEFGQKTKNWFLSVLPQTVLPRIDKEGRVVGATGIPGFKMPLGFGMKIPQEQIEPMNKELEALRDTFRQKYLRSQQEFENWQKAHPELAAPKWATEGSRLQRLKDPFYWSYVIASNAPQIAGTMGVTIGVAAATGNPMLGTMAGIGVMLPAQTQDLYEDLLANGATEQQATGLAVPIGALISIVEVAGDIPMLKAVSPAFMKLFKKELGTEVAKLTAQGLIAKGIKTAGQVELSETLEEVIQQAMQNAAVKTVNENRSLLEGLTDTTIQAAIASLPFALIGGGMGFTSDLNVKATTKGIEIQATIEGKLQTIVEVEEGADSITITNVDIEAEEMERAISLVKFQAEMEGKTVINETPEAQHDAVETELEKPLVETPVTEGEKATQELPTLANQVKALHKEVMLDVDAIRQDITKRRDIGARLTRQILKGTEREIREADAIIKKMERGQDVTEAELAKVKAKLEATRQFYKTKMTTEVEVKKALVDYIQQTLPLEERGRLLDAVKNAKTEADLGKVMERVEGIAEAATVRTLRAEIEKQLKATKAKGEMPKGKYTAEVQQQLDGIRNYLFANNKAVLKSLSADDLGKALDRIKELRTEGHSEHVAREVARQEEMETQRAKIVDTITGGQGLKPGAESVSAKGITKTFSRVRGAIEKIVNLQYSWSDLLDKLSKFSKTEPNQSDLSLFGRIVPRSNEVENVGRAKQLDNLRQNFSRIFGVTKPKDIKNTLRNMSSEKVNLGKFKNADGVEVEFTGLTKGQILKKYQEMQDPTLDKTFTMGMKWTQEIKDAFTNALSTQERAWGDYLMQFLRDYYPSINEVFVQMNNVDLPNNQFYTPIAREMDPDIEYNLLDPNDMLKFAGVAPGGLKSRVNNLHPLKFTDATQTVLKHVVEMEHYKAWAGTMRDLRSVLGNKDVRSAILQYHGQDILNLIDAYLNDFARGGIDRAHTVAILDKLRNNFATSVIGLKPNIALQQLPTVFSYMTEMKMGSFIKGVADFWAHPIENYKWMMENSPYIKERYQAGFERDIKAALASDQYREFTGKANIRDAAFWLMTQGDKFGVIQGWWAKYKEGLRNGLSQVDAMEEANLLTDRTQNTSSIDTLSALQRGGSFWKLLTMFQNQPNKYFKIIGNNMRNLQYGRGSKVNATKSILIAWVILPAIFQAIADGFQWKKEHQIRAVALGPINDLLVIGQIMQTVAGWFAGENFEYSPSPIIGGIKDYGTAIQKGIALSNKGEDPYKDISMDDVIAFVESLAKPTGEVLGVPTPYIIQVEKAIRAGEPKELIFSRWALEAPPMGLNEKAQQAIAGLGQVIEPEPGKVKELSDKPLPVYDMGKLNSDFKEIFSKTLPKDIGSKFDPLAVAWGQKEISRSIAETLPNVSLNKINTDLNEDDTIVQYYQQWQARSQITSLEQLKEFDALYPKAYLGNVTREQYDLLVKYAALDKKAQEEFLKAHPELTINPRDEWLKSHPEDNARLAIWGQAKVLTQAAFDTAQKMIKNLGIPEDAITGYLPPADVAKDYFLYNDAEDKWGASSAEVKLILAKNQKLCDWLGREPVTTPIKALELMVKNRTLQDQYDAYGDKESSLYFEDKKARETAREKLKADNPEFADDLVRIDAYKMGASDTIVNYKVEYNRLPLGTARMDYRLKHPDFDAWLVSKEGYSPAKASATTLKETTPSTTATTSATSRIDTLYKAYQNLPAGTARTQYRQAHPDLDAWLVATKGYKPVTQVKKTVSTGKQGAIEHWTKAAEAEAINQWIKGL